MRHTVFVCYKFHMCYGLFKVKINRGKDFQPALANIGGLTAMTDVPFMTLKAPVSADTEAAIVKFLQLKQPAIITHQLHRANIHLLLESCKVMK